MGGSLSAGDLALPPSSFSYSSPPSVLLTQSREVLEFNVDADLRREVTAQSKKAAPGDHFGPAGI